MKSSLQKRKCVGLLLLGFFFLITGAAFSVDVFVNRPYLFYDSQNYQNLWKSILWAFLIAWNAAGLCILLFGWLKPCEEI